MPKSKKEITNNDRKILDTLTENARQSLIEISEKTGLSRQTVQKTILKLEKDHVTWGYQPIVDEQKKGLKEYLILIKRTTKPLNEKTTEVIISRKLDKLASSIGAEIVSSFYCHGSYDWVISLLAPDIKSAKKFTEHLKTVHLDVISDVQLLETLFFAKKERIINPDIKNLKEYIL